MRKFLIALFVVVFSSFLNATTPLVSVKAANGYSYLVSQSAVAMDSTNTVYSTAFLGSAINGKKIVIACTVVTGSDSSKTYDIDLQGSFDGTNFFTVSAAVINDKATQTAATNGGTVDLTSYLGIPYYRIAFIPSGDVADNGTFKILVSQ